MRQSIFEIIKKKDQVLKCGLFLVEGKFFYQCI